MRRHPEHLAGGGKRIATAPGAYVDPTMERDMALLAQAIGIVQRQIASLGASKQMIPSQLTNWLRTMRSFQRDISYGQGRSNARLSDGARKAVMRTIGIKELPPLRDATPEVLKHLPLKPPGRT